MDDDHFDLLAGFYRPSQFPESPFVFEGPPADFNQYSGFHFSPGISLL
jgi:hypothetical protein